jgi:putative oxidoreductase
VTAVRQPARDLVAGFDIRVPCSSENPHAVLPGRDVYHRLSAPEPETRSPEPDKAEPILANGPLKGMLDTVPPRTPMHKNQRPPSTFTHVFRSPHDLTLFVLRLVVGIIFFVHGSQKALGWFDGPGFNATVETFREMGIPFFFAILAIGAEFLGSIGLIVGFLSRIAALGIGCVMVVATLMIHLQNGFLMNWLGKQSGEGFEFHLLVLAIVLALMVRGAGAWSLDRWVSHLIASNRSASQ